ncbi:hypothetical protein Dip518_000634 [Parelusimicrobium proximum]
MPENTNDGEKNIPFWDDKHLGDVRIPVKPNK